MKGTKKMNPTPERIEYLLATLITAQIQITEIIKTDPPAIYITNLKQQQVLIRDAQLAATYLLLNLLRCEVPKCLHCNTPMIPAGISNQIDACSYEGLKELHTELWTVCPNCSVQLDNGNWQSPEY